MANSWKIGAGSGLIAGLASGVVFAILVPIAFALGFFSIWREALATAGVITFLLDVVWGIIFGIVYSKINSVIPGKGIVKGLLYGLILYIFVNIRMNAFFGYAYGYIIDTNGWLLTKFFSWIIYGFFIGFFYEFLLNKYYPMREKSKILTYDVKSGILPGAIAGLLAGIAASIMAIVGPAIGVWRMPGSPDTLTFDFWLSQAGSHIFINMVWGVAFGLVYTKVYNLVPKRGIVKGLIYSMIIWVLFAFYHWSFNFGWYAFLNNWPMIMYAAGVSSIGIAHFIVLGLVLGLLYRKPSD